MRKKAKTKAEKVLHKIYTKLYAEASPSVNYDEFIEECIASGKKREVDGAFIVPYDYYYLNKDRYSEIVEKTISRHKLNKLEERSIAFEAYLGHGPTSRVVKGNKEIEDYIYEFPTKHKEGFISSEITHIRDLFKGMHPEFNIESFYEALSCNTGLLKGGDSITFHCDIFRAVLCGVENRELKLSEWD